MVIPELIRKEDIMKNKLRKWISLAAGIGLMMILSGCGASSNNYPSGSTGIDWKDFNEGLVEASSLSKPMIVLYETSWCSWCKKLNKTTLSDPEVARKINESFVAVKIDGEGSGIINYKDQKLTEREFTKSLGVRGFPTTIFFDSNGEVISGQPGYLDAEQMGNLLAYIGDGAYQNEKFEDFLQKQQAG